MPQNSRKPTRRPNNEGSLYKRADGTWCSQVTVGYNPDTGRPIRKTFYGKTQKEVKDKKDETMQKLKEGQSFKPEADCMANDFIKNWLITYKRTSVSPRTFEWCCNITEKHIYPAFNSVKLRDITSDQIQALLITYIEDKQKSLRLVKGIRDLLNQALSYAVDSHLIAENPVERTRLPKSDRDIETKEKEPISKEMRQRILKAAESDKIMYPIIITLMYTGIRAGELLALIWKNVDFDQRIITIDRALTLTPEFDKDGKRTSRNSSTKTTKTESGIRKIIVPAFVTEALLKWKEHLQTKNPELVESEKPVFSGKCGGQRTYNGLRASYRHFLGRNGLDQEDLHLHRYRHNFATMMLEEKVNPRVVQKIMGHKNIETTLGTYSHVTKEVYEDVANTLEKVYERTKNAAIESPSGQKPPHDSTNSEA